MTGRHAQEKTEGGKNYFYNDSSKIGFHTQLKCGPNLRGRERRESMVGGKRGETREGVRERGKGGGVLPVAIPHCPHRQPGNLGGLQAT